MKPKNFATEADLCAAFLAKVDDRLWTSYPETQSWDILLSRKKDGFQVGIQAKLSLNIDVINQAIEEYGHWSAASPGPDCRAVLVPQGGAKKLGRICDYLGLVVITQASPSQWSNPRFYPDLPTPTNCDWHEWCPTRRHELPEYIPDVTAGASSPLQLTDWKIKAIKLAVLLERNGCVHRTDFKHLQLDHRRWIANGWLKLPPKTKEGPNGYVAGALPDFKKQHPRVYGEIAAKFETWKPKQGLV